MTNITRKFGTAVATVALLANSFAGIAAAGTTIEITGNGAGADSAVQVQQVSNTSVTQNNTANVTNNVDSNASTGGNDANYNTGGDVHIDTGKASSDATVSNVLNSNSAEVDCCASGDTEVTISGNGAKSDNAVDLTQATNTIIDQDNQANVTNNVDSSAKTGKNDANGNTGGDVTIYTGDAYADSSVSTVANVNSARVKGGHGSNPSASFLITGNGYGSDNYILAALASNTIVDQDNNANITNNVDADAKTGKNDANYNTGGDVMIDTGNADADVIVDNSVNFNFADLDCGCLWDVTAKIAGNGADGYSHHRHGKSEPDNYIGLNLATAQAAAQDNQAYLTNNADADAKTGYNEAELNTGEPESDPSINTGDAYTDSNVSNSGNVNTVGDAWDWEVPEMPEVEFSFSFAAMMAFFGLSL